MYTPFLRAIVLLCLSNLALAANYRDIADVYQPIANLSAFHYLHGSLKVASQLPQVRARDVRMIIHAKQGDIPVSTSDDGNFAFPFSDALMAENPSVEFNQPPGTVALRAAVDVSTNGVQTFNFKLFDAMAAEYSTWQAQRLGWLARMHRAKAKGLLIRFPAGTDSSANIILPGGTEHLLADAKHEIRLSADSAWAHNNAQVVLSSLPAAIELDIN
jgi:hypothetical protein